MKEKKNIEENTWWKSINKTDKCYFNFKLGNERKEFKYFIKQESKTIKQNKKVKIK
jgi:hypothetical protein